MPRHHFHVVDEHVSLDLSIVDLPDYDAALARAEQFAVALLMTETYGKSPDAWEVRVTDERGRKVLAMPLSEVITKK